MYRRHLEESATKFRKSCYGLVRHPLIPTVVFRIPNPCCCIPHGAVHAIGHVHDFIFSQEMKASKSRHPRFGGESLKRANLPNVGFKLSNKNSHFTAGQKHVSYMLKDEDGGKKKPSTKRRALFAGSGSFVMALQSSCVSFFCLRLYLSEVNTSTVEAPMARTKVQGTPNEGSPSKVLPMCWQSAKIDRVCRAPGASEDHAAPSMPKTFVTC